MTTTAQRNQVYLPAQFISKILPFARASTEKTGIATSFIIAQAALEASWGNSKLARTANNLFGIKSSPTWKGQTITMVTTEYIAGVPKPTMASWRAYPDWGASIDDHSQFFFDNQRYKQSLTVKNDPVAFAKAIQSAGYATDPSYANKIIAIIESRKLLQFDQVY